MSELPKNKEEKDKFLNKINEHRKKRTDTMVTAILTDMLGKDLPFFDFFYIDKRVRQLLESVWEKLDWHSTEVSDARRAFLKSLIKNARKNIPKPEKFKPKDIADVSTTERDNRCESTACDLVDMLLNEELLFSDDYWLSTALSDDNRLLLLLTVKGYVDSVMQGLEFSINESLRRANRNLWGNDREEITMKQLDKILKNDTFSSGNTIGKR